MPNQTSSQSLHPTNPILVKDINVPREKGQTRVLPDGSLLYREPIMGEEMQAVRLEDIRSRLVQEAAKKLSYRFPKKRGYEDTNVTAFVKKDYNYGPKRENRPDRLFQIQSDGTKGEKPDGYVMDRGRIVLDAFDHGLRNFGNQLPMYVSSELEGHDIEDYIRRNREISIYDLVARAPNGYYQRQPKTKNKNPQKDERAREWHEGPPRVGTFSMRATRFRLAAGCLSWEKKDGTAAKNQRILDVIPAQYKDPAVNSTKGWRDLNKAEIKRIKDGAMRKPQQGPKAKRAAQAGMVLERKVCPVEDFAEGEGFLEEGEGVQHQAEDAWNVAPNEQNSGLWQEANAEGSGSTMPIPQPSQVDLQGRGVWQPPTVKGETFANTRTEPSNMDSLQSRKRSRGHSDANTEESTNLQAQKRARTTNDAQNHGIVGGYTRIRTSRMGRLPQQRGPAPEPPYIARGTSPAPMHPAIGSSSQASHRAVGQLYNSSNAANEVSPLPDLSKSNGGPSTYASSLYQPQQFLPFERGPTDFSAPLPHPNARNRPQQHPQAPNTSIKRKRSPSNSSSSTTSHPNGPYPNKRIKAHTTTQHATALQFQPPTDAAARGSKSPAPNPSYQVPSPPYHEQTNTPHILFPPPPGARNQPECSQRLLPSALQGEQAHSWMAETYPIVSSEEEGEEGYTPPPTITIHQEETIAHLETRAAGMDAYFTPFDSRQMIQDGHGSPRGVGGRGEGGRGGGGGGGGGGGHESRYPPVDWYHGRWDGMVHDGGSWMQDGWDRDGEGGI